MARTADTSTRRSRAPVAMDVILALACASLALWVHRRALAAYFHPDDLISMEWARGILPSPDFGPWRLLSGKLFFAAALGAFGTNPIAYHVLNAVLHMANVVLLYSLVRRWGASRPAATLGAGLFGAARPVFSVLQQAVGIGELLALGFTLAALQLCERRTFMARVAAVMLFLAALLSKEGVLLLPVVLLVPREPGSWLRLEAWRDRLRVAAPTLLTSAAGGASLAIAHVRERALGGEAYAMGFGTNLFHNLMTYTAWAFDVWNPFYDDPGRISTEAWRVGLPIVAALIALAWVTRRRTRLPIVGLVWAGLTMAPVLPLLHHTYASYLYAPLAGLGIALGAGLDSLVPKPAPQGERRKRDPTSHAKVGDRRGIALAVAMAAVLIAHAANSDRLLAARVERRLREVDLPFDRQLQKSEMVRRAVDGLKRTSPGVPRRIVLYLPRESTGRLDPHTGQMLRDTTMTLERMLMYLVLDGGRALRALTPSLDSVAFVSRWTAEYDGFDLCVNAPEGDIIDLGRGPEAHLELGRLLMRGGYVPLAVEHLTQACAVYPRDSSLRQLLVEAKAAR